MFKLDQKETFGGWCDVIRCHTESDFKMLLFVCLIHSRVMVVRILVVSNLVMVMHLND